MTLFVAIAAAMLALACAWVLIPLLKRRGGVAIEREASNLNVLRDQRAELDADLANGIVSRQQYDIARNEFDRRVLEESGNDTPAARAAHSTHWTAAILAALLPMAAVALYLVLGNPVALSPETLAARTARDPGQAVTAADVETMIDRVKERLSREPGNLEGWVVLARTYYVLGRAPEAVGAFERAVALAPGNADLLADYADAIGMTQNQSLEGKPAALVARALKADPDQWKANALAGTIALQRKDYAKAIEHWERVKANVPADSPVAQSIDASLVEARQLLASTGAPAAAPSSATLSATPKGGAKVAGTVSIAPALATSVSPEDTVFVFARPVGGSRMPLALLRAKVKDLPLAFTLDDKQAMLPAHRISDHAEVIVGARVSRSGTATPQPGDSETLSAPVKVGEAGLALVIDRKLP